MPNMSELPVRLQRILVGHRGCVNTVIFNASGDYCLTGGNDKTVKLWNPHRNTPSEDTHDDPSLSSSLSCHFASSPLPRGLLVKTYSGPHNKPVTAVAVSGDSERIASAGGDKMVFLWDVSTGATLRRIAGHTERVNAVAMNCRNDGSAHQGGQGRGQSPGRAEVLFTGSYDGTVAAWDLRSSTRRPIQEMKGFKDSVTDIIVGKGNQLIICTSVDGCVRVSHGSGRSVFKEMWHIAKG